MGKTTIYRTVFQIEVFSEGPLDVEVDDNDPFNLKEIAYAITEGDCIGNVEQISSEAVRPDEVKGHLLRIGNDGHFFSGRHDVDEEEGP